MRYWLFTKGENCIYKNTGDKEKKQDFVNKHKNTLQCATNP